MSGKHIFHRTILNLQPTATNMPYIIVNASQDYQDYFQNNFNHARNEFLAHGLSNLTDERTMALYADTCAICYEPLGVSSEERPSDAVAIVSCSHSFHRSCLWPWLDRPAIPTISCPMCRRELFTNPQILNLSNELPDINASQLVHLATIADAWVRVESALACALAESSAAVNARLADADPFVAQFQPLLNYYGQLLRLEGPPWDTLGPVPDELSTEIDETFEALSHTMHQVLEIVNDAQQMSRND